MVAINRFQPINQNYKTALFSDSMYRSFVPTYSPIQDTVDFSGKSSTNVVQFGQKSHSLTLPLVVFSFIAVSGTYLYNNKFINEFLSDKFRELKIAATTLLIKKALKEYGVQHAQAAKKKDRDAMLAVENKILYHPHLTSPISTREMNKIVEKSGFERPEIKLSDQLRYDFLKDIPKKLQSKNKDVKLNVLYYPPKNNQPVLILLTGQNGNIKRNLAFFDEKIKGTDLGCVIYEYPGFGHSQGVPSEQSLYASLEAVSQYLVKQDIPFSDQILFGPSIGGAVATELATKHPYKGLVLVSTMTSAARVFMDLCRQGGIEKQVKDPRKNIIQRFDTLRKIKNLQAPVIHAHGGADEYIVLNNFEQLQKKIPEQYNWFSQVYEGAGHNAKDLLNVSEKIWATAASLLGINKSENHKSQGEYFEAS